MVVFASPRTARGEGVLESARTLYERLRARAATIPHGEGLAEAALLAAVYGAGELRGAEWERAVAAVVPPKPAVGDGGGHSCGSSCGSSCGGGCDGCGA